MGGGHWTSSTYAAKDAYKAATATPDFAYSAATTKAPRSSWTVHEDLDPKKVNNDGAHKGQNIRESLDNTEHPTSLAISVLFDVTGSMRKVPQLLLKKLPGLWGLLLRKGYVEHPQIMFGAIGDAYSDRVPLQVGQFESDNRSDDDLEKILLEGGGGGSSQESYELAMYFMANHTYTDCLEKRGHKGYLFIIGDEGFYPQVDRNQVNDIIGDTLQASISTEQVIKNLKSKYEVFIIRPQGSAYQVGTPEGDIINEAWRKQFGQNVINLDDDKAVCETIAVQIGLAEGSLGDLDEGLRDLHEVGSGDAVAAVGKALATVGAGGPVAVSDAPNGVGEGTDSIERL